uniref:SXP/RAL-2 family protein Ani s 5-like cation-binding domain-containing protein n=1 Tax=Panagrellus redivivus TaxID=6233 RepID=A0A7E4ZW47_PANRE
MHPCRLSFVLLATVIIGSNAYLRFEETGQNAALAKKIAFVNETLHKALEKQFLAKTVKAVASMDSTVRKLITTIYSLPSAAFTCIQSNMSSMSASSVARLTLSTLTETIAKACPKYKTELYAVENATIAIKTRLDNYTPEVIANLPPGIYNLLTTAGNLSLIMLNDADLGNSLTFQEAVIDEMVTQINGLNDTDRKAFAKIIPWTAPFITPNGKYSDSLRDTLNAINTGLRKSFNISELAPALTTLTLGAATKLPAALRWAYNTIDALPVSNTVSSDSTIAIVANLIAEVGNMYGGPAVRSYDVTKTMQLLLGGRFQFTDYVYTYNAANYYYY